VISENQPAQSGRWCATVLILVVCIVFARVCGFEFIAWDDQFTIAGNPHLLQPTAESLLQIWKSPDPGLYIPLTYTVWWMLAMIARVSLADGSTGLNPWIFHSANLLVHLAGVLLLFALLRRLRFNPWCACGGAMVFAIHPLQVESIAWATGMRDVLGGALGILALLQYVQSRYRAAAFVMLLATLAKPSSIMLLPMAIAMDRLLWGFTWKQIARRTWPMGVVALTGAVLTLWAQPRIHEGISIPWQRPLIAFDAITFYLSKLIVPIHLVFDYGRRPAGIVTSGQIWWTWILPVIVTALLLWSGSKRLQLAGAWFVLALLPVLGLVPFAFQSISTVADHYTYPAMTGVAIFMASCLQRLNSNAGRAVIIAIACMWAILSFHQTSTWRDDARFFAQATRVNPLSAPAWNGLAGLRLREGRLDEALQAASRAINADPDHAAARFTMIGIRMRMGDHQGVDRDMKAFLKAYQNQKNFDPKLADAMRARIEQMKQK